VTRTALVLALAAWDEAGAHPGDRIEHASVTPIELAAVMARLGLTVVTQPGFIAARGDSYRRDVDPADLDDLYRCGTLLAHGVQVGGSTDAPFGPDDPWVAIRSAVERSTESGAALGPTEALAPAAALALFLAPLDQPGAAPRTIEVGRRADFCLLDGPLDDALADLSSGRVATTVSAGRITYQR
jgi:predicted amidohydrolase YtcJ